MYCLFPSLQCDFHQKMFRLSFLYELINKNSLYMRMVNQRWYINKNLLFLLILWLQPASMLFLFFLLFVGELIIYFGVYYLREQTIRQIKYKLAKFILSYIKMIADYVSYLNYSFICIILLPNQFMWKKRKTAGIRLITSILSLLLKDLSVWRNEYNLKSWNDIRSYIQKKWTTHPPFWV